MTKNIIDFILGVAIPVVKSPYMNFVSAGIGWIACNRLSISRDKRKEWNVLIEPIKNKLIQSIRQPGINIDLADHSIFDIRNELFVCRRRRFDRAIVEYRKSISEKNRKKDELGGFTYIYPEKITHASKNLLKYIKKK